MPKAVVAVLPDQREHGAVTTIVQRRLHNCDVGPVRLRTPAATAGYGVVPEHQILATAHPAVADLVY